MQSPDTLTLEEVMCCYYRLPCRRISPGTKGYQKYGRGSLLIYENEIVLILLPEDDTLFFVHKRLRFVGPRRQYKGVLPGSVIYSNCGNKINVLKGFVDVQEMREKLPLAWETPTRAADNERCNEAFGLAANSAVERFANLPKPVGTYDDIAQWIVDSLE